MKHCIKTYNRSSKLKLNISDSVKLINRDHWDGLVGNKNIYLSTAYLESLEESLHDNIDFRYILFYDLEYTPVGVAVVQLLQFSNKELNAEDLKNRFGHLISDKIISKIDARVMLCGNAFATGENGFYFCESIPEETSKINLSNAFDRIKRVEKRANKGVSLILLKDFWPESFHQIEVLKDEDFSSFMIDVNMVVKIREEWQTFDDYMHDMVTKFRTKMKSIYKKSADIESRALSIEEIAKYKEDIDSLYHNVLQRADYRFGELTANTFYNLGKNLPDNYVLMGYFLDGKLVGFSSCFKTFDKVIDANFVGLDYALNHDYALYQRILGDLVKFSIESNARELRLGRTAEQIKSCFGAEPVEMKLMVKHRNSITNKLVRPLVSHITPSKYELRRPFKAVLYQ